MSESFKQQIKNLKTKIQEKRQLYIEQETRQNTEIDEIKAELQSIKRMVEEMEAKVEINIEKQNEDKLKDFDELFNGEMEKLKADLLDILENSEIVTTPRNELKAQVEEQLTTFKSELNAQTSYIKDIETKLKDLINQFQIIQSKPKIILHKK